MTAAVLQPLRQIALALFLLAAAVVATLAAPVALQALQTQYWPVLHDWRARVEVRGADVVVVGTMRKRSVPACEYIPPQRVLDLDTGEHLALSSLSPTSGQNWPGSDERRAFGPWVVAGGAGRRLQFYSEHECSPLWRSFSMLGVVDTRGGLRHE